MPAPAMFADFELAQGPHCVLLGGTIERGEGPEIIPPQQFAGRRPHRRQIQFAVNDPRIRSGERIRIPQMQKIIIPLKDFDILKINPDLREKIAENFYIKFSPGASYAVEMDDLRFDFKKFTFNNYIDVLISGPFGRYFFNSIFITFCVVTGNMIFSSMVGYAFARKEFPFKKSIFMIVIGSLMIPTQVIMVPVFILIKNLGWLNTYWALTLPALLCPFNIFLMRQYISKLPISLEEAARIDGCSDFGIFFRVVLPLARPALAVIGINAFMGSWNTFLYPFILTNTPQMRTLPVGLALYKSLQGVDWVHLMAGSSITALPVIIVFLIFQKNIIAGLTAGATKG